MASISVSNLILIPYCPTVSWYKVFIPYCSGVARIEQLPGHSLIFMIIVINKTDHFSTILLFLSLAAKFANKSTTSSKDISLASSFSIERIAKSVNRCSVIVDHRYVLIRFRAEKDLSHSAVLTAIVKAM